jgi:RNA polymerase sigma-70 factor (ECF subfamily)
MAILDFWRGASALRGRLVCSRADLYRVALAWCGDRSLADDLTQETLTRALRKCHQLRDPERLECWLYRILANCWKQHLRDRRTEVELSEDEVSLEAGPERRAERSQIIDQVRSALNRLPVEQREVIALVDLRGMSYSEVAEVLDIPIGTVMSRLCRGRRRLQAALAEAEAAAAPGAHLRRVK